MPSVEVREVVPASPDHVFRVLSDMAAFPRFMKTVESITIMERGDGYTLSEWVAKLQGARFRWVERDEFYPAEGRITYHQVKGDLKSFQGYWALTPTSDGQTEVTLVTEFEFGIPMLASLLNPVAKIAIRDNARAMLQAIREELQP